MRDARTIYGVDRATIWLDVADPRLPLKRIAAHCGDVDLRVGQMPYNARWKSCIRLHQPDRRALKLLNEALGQTICAAVTYAEIAADVPCADAEQAQELQCRLLGALRVPYARDEVIIEQGTAYFDRRARPSNSRREPDRRAPHVRVVYADKPTKLNNARPDDDSPPAVHLEWRASGAAALRRVGIGSVGDLAAFDHAAFWRDAVHLYELPGPTELGRLLAASAGTDQDVSGEALRRRAHRWRDAATIDGAFVLQNALRNRPGVANRLKRIQWDAWWCNSLQMVST